MADNNQLSNKVNQLTTAFQQLLALGKKISQLPAKAFLDGNSKIAIDTNGVTESITVAQIVNDAINSSFDGIISLGAMTLVGNTLTIASPSKAKINGIIYTSGENTINIPFSATGLVRQDILVFDTNSNIIRIAGVETEGIAVAPNKPNNTVFVTSVLVTDSAIGEPSEPIIGTNYVNIPSQGIYQYSANAVDTVVASFEIPTIKHIEIIANVLEVQNIVNEEYMYSGFDIKIINKQNTNITFTESVNTKLIDGISQILKPNETIHFVFDGLESFTQSGAISGASLPLFTPNKLLASDASGAVVVAERFSIDQYGNIVGGINQAGQNYFYIKTLANVGSGIYFYEEGNISIGTRFDRFVQIYNLDISNRIYRGSYQSPESDAEYIQRGYIDELTGAVNGLAEFNKQIFSASFTGDTNKTLTLTKQDGTIITASFLDGGGGEFPDDVLNTLTFNADNDGVLYAVTSLGEIISVSLDGRYSLLNHVHTDYTLKGGYAGTAQDIVNYVGWKEDKSNKQNDLTPDASNLKFPTVTAVISALLKKIESLSTSPVPMKNVWHGTLEQFKTLYAAGLLADVEYNFIKDEQKVHDTVKTVNLDMWDKDVMHICKAAVTFNLPAIGTISHSNGILVLSAGCSVSGGIGLVKVDGGAISTGGNQTIGIGLWKLVQELGTSNYMLCKV